MLTFYFVIFGFASAPLLSLEHLKLIIMSQLETSQDKEMFGNMETPYFILESVSEDYPETKKDLENFKKAILHFNSVGIEIDISLRYDTVIFHKTD